MIANSVLLLRTPSIAYKNNNAGPSVINAKSNDGGYLVTFKKDIIVYTLFFYSTPGNRFPYIFMDLIIIKSMIVPFPR